MIDLKEQYGKKYKVAICEPGEGGCYEIIGKRGYIRPYGDGLEMYLTSAVLAGRVERLYPAFRPKNHYDDATAFEFENKLELVASAAKWVKARNRKQYTPEQREAMASRMRLLRNKP
jgi:hypothetical protein